MLLQATLGDVDFITADYLAGNVLTHLILTQETLY